MTTDSIARFATAVVAAATLVGSPIAEAATPLPTPSARLVFVRGMVDPADGGLTATDIYAVNPDGTSLGNLTALDPADDLAPSWSPRGSKLAFVRVDRRRAVPSYSIWVMNGDGSGAHALVAPFTGGPDQCRFEACGAALAPSWSPDGKQIAYARWDSRNILHLWLIRSSGSDPRRLTGQPLNDANPRWAPDGKTISFFRTDPSRKRLPAIWTLRVRSGRAVRLVRLTGTCGTLCPQVGQTSWSANMRTLVFGEPFGAKSGGVVEFDLRRRRQRRLAIGLEPDLDAGSGTQVAFAAPAETDGRFRIARVNTRSRIAIGVTDPSWPLSDEYPAWRPSG